MDFTKDYSRQNLTRFLIPLIAADLFQQIYSLINTIVVSRVLNYRAVAVIGTCSGFLAIRSNLLSGMLFGFGIYLGKAMGSKDQNFFRQVFSGSFWYALCLGISGIILLPFTQIMLTIGNIPSQLSKDAFWYLAVSFGGNICIALKLLLIVTLQSIGETRFYSFLAAAGVIINTVLVVLFIGVFHGGVAFSALATILTNLLLAGCLYFYIRKKHPQLLSLLFPSSISRPVWLDLLKNGVAKTLYFALGSLGKLVLQRSINNFPIKIIAGQSWAICLQTILFSPLGELGTASGVITGQNAGAGNTKNILLYHEKLIKLMLILGGAAVGFVYLAGYPTLQLLTDAEQSPIIPQAAHMWLQITVLAMPFCFTILYRNSLQAFGQYRRVVILGAVEFVGICITACLVVPIYGYRSAAIGMAVSWLLQAALGSFFFRHSVKGGNFLGAKNNT